MPTGKGNNKGNKNKLKEYTAIRSDLAIEAREALAIEPEAEIDGLHVENDGNDEMKISRVSILNESAAKTMGKAQGKYITLEVPGLRGKNSILQEKVSQQLAIEIEAIMDLKNNPEKTVMVVGLGNWNVTPDALGPRVVKDLLVTRHILKLEPDTLQKDQFRAVCAISPGVLGITGIETKEIIEGLVEQAKPDLLLVIDALAARQMSRLHTTIQIADTGIHPGSGVGNRRVGITEESLGVPVLALGVPTVVDAITIASDSMDRVMAAFSQESKESKHFLNVMKEMSAEDKRKLLHEVLSPFNENLMVTPKEVDTLIEDTARLIAGSINAALHPGIEPKDAAKYLH